MEIVRLDEHNAREVIKKAVSVLKKGGIVLYPTDTLYGLAVDALNSRALVALRELKGRESKKPISIIVPDVESILLHAELPMYAKWYADRFLPGALTLVLPAKSHVPKELMLNGQIGIRIPEEAFARELARALGNPITATSANRSGLPTLPLVKDIVAQFGHLAHDIDLAIDAGERSGTSSTVLTFVEDVAYVVRDGALSREELGL